MYADQIEAHANRSIKDRLDGRSSAGFVRRRPISGKRAVFIGTKCLEDHCFSFSGGNEAPYFSEFNYLCRQREDDDKWEHDLFEENEPQLSSRRIGKKDLRLKLQRKSIEQTVRGSTGGARDLREKLSGALYSRRVESKPPPARLRPAPEASKPPRKSVIAQAPVPETKVASSVPKKKAQQKVESVDNFLKSLDLEKYSITFQAEEVDMTALVHMSDEDLKAMGIPMGPRKKILLALESRSDD